MIDVMRNGVYSIIDSSCFQVGRHIGKSMIYHQITTPEHVTFRYEIAGVASRAIAWLIDFLITSLFKILVVWIMWHFVDVSAAFAFALVFLTFFVIDFVYYTFFELQKFGQTPGKKALGLRVVLMEGSQPNFPDILLRNVARAIDMLPIGYGIGGIVAIIDRYHRRLGDLIGGTIVVRDAPQSVPSILSAQGTQNNTFYDDPSIRQKIVTRITRDERDFLMDLSMRKDELAFDRRIALFKRSADYFRRRYTLPEEMRHMSDEQTVICVAQVIHKYESDKAGSF